MDLSVAVSVLSDSGHSPATELLALPDTSKSDGEARTWGVQGLLARGLAETTAETLTIEPRLRIMASVLAQPRQITFVATAGGKEMAMLRIVSGAHLSVALTPKPFGLIGAVPLRGAVALGDVLADAVLGSFSAHTNPTALVAVEWCDSTEADLAVELTRTPNGSIRVLNSSLADVAVGSEFGAEALPTCLAAFEASEGLGPG